MLPHHGDYTRLHAQLDGVSVCHGIRHRLPRWGGVVDGSRYAGVYSTRLLRLYVAPLGAPSVVGCLALHWRWAATHAAMLRRARYVSVAAAHALKLRAQFVVPES
jgi:hypothetical protein